MTVHKVPDVTMKLGTVLDATLTEGRHRHFVNEWRGFQLLSDFDAFERRAPHCHLYLVRGRIGAQPKRAPSASKLDHAEDGYHRWHKRDAARLGELDTAAAKYLQGRMTRIGYSSDKWARRGRTTNYDHDFLEDDGTAPLVYTNARTLGASTTIVVVGGSMLITAAGIA